MNRYQWVICAYVFLSFSLCLCVFLSVSLLNFSGSPSPSPRLPVSEPFLPIPSTPHPCPSLPCSSPSIHLCLTAHHRCLVLHPQDSPSTPSDHRMLELSLPWLGLGPVAASPWLLLLLVGASWILAHILAWTYTFYNNCRRLQYFPQPLKCNWFLGHLYLVSFLGDPGRSGMGSGFGLGSRAAEKPGRPGSPLFPHSLVPLLCL